MSFYCWGMRDLPISLGNCFGNCTVVGSGGLSPAAAILTPSALSLQGSSGGHSGDDDDEGMEEGVEEDTSDSLVATSADLAGSDDEAAPAKSSAAECAEAQAEMQKDRTVHDCHALDRIFTKFGPQDFELLRLVGQGAFGKVRASAPGCGGLAPPPPHIPLPNRMEPRDSMTRADSAWPTHYQMPHHGWQSCPLAAHPPGLPGDVQEEEAGVRHESDAQRQDPAEGARGICQGGA